MRRIFHARHLRIVYQSALTDQPPRGCSKSSWPAKAGHPRIGSSRSKQNSWMPRSSRGKTEKGTRRELALTRLIALARLVLGDALGRGAGAARLGAARRAPGIGDDAELHFLEPPDFVAQPRRLLEFH